MTEDRYPRDPRQPYPQRNAHDELRRNTDPRAAFWRSIDEDRGLTRPTADHPASAPHRGPRDGDTWYSAPPYGPNYSDDAGREERYRTRDGGSVRGGFAGRGPRNYVRTDDRIREEVCERLSWDDEVDATDVAVSVKDGEVTLEGTVETRHMKRHAEDLAEAVAGVRDVHNGIRVRKPILTEIKEKIAGDTRKEHFANTGTKTTGPTTSYNRH